MGVGGVGCVLLRGRMVIGDMGSGGVGILRGFMRIVLCRLV